jgi:hypothetical protein
MFVLFALLSELTTLLILMIKFLKTKYLQAINNPEQDKHPMSADIVGKSVFCYTLLLQISLQVEADQQKHFILMSSKKINLIELHL